MVGLNGYLLPYFDIVDAFQDCESMADAHDVHLLELFMLESYQCFSNNFILCMGQRQPSTWYIFEEVTGTDELFAILR